MPNDVGAENPGEGHKKSAGKNKFDIFDFAAKTMDRFEQKLPEIVDELTIKNLPKMNEDEFALFLQNFEERNKIKEIPKTAIILKGELFQLKKEKGEDYADEKYKTAMKKFHEITGPLKEMKAAGVAHIKIYEKLLKYHGEYEGEQSSVILLLTDGKGNCSARGRLMVMALEELFGNDTQLFTETVNVYRKDKKNAGTHQRTIVKDGAKYYVIELPAVKEISAAEMKKRTTYATDIYAKAYLVSRGKATYSRKESLLPSGMEVEGGKGNDVFALPNSSLVEYRDPNMSYSAVVDARIKKLAKQDGKEKMPRGKGPKEKVQPGIDDYSFLKVLDDPDIAQRIVDQAKARGGYLDDNKLYLTGLQSITAECAEIISNYEGNLYLGSGSGLNLDMPTLQALTHRPWWSNYSPSTKIVLQGDMTEERARAFEDFFNPDYGNFLLIVRGGITPKVAALLGSFRSKPSFRFQNKIDAATIKTIIGSARSRSYTYIASDVGIDPSIIDDIFKDPIDTGVGLGNVETTITPDLINKIGHYTSPYLHIGIQKGGEISVNRTWYRDILDKYDRKERIRFVVRIPLLTDEIAEAISNLRCHRLEVQYDKASETAYGKLFGTATEDIVVNNIGYTYSAQKNSWEQW